MEVRYAERQKREQQRQRKRYDPDVLQDSEVCALGLPRAH